MYVYTKLTAAQGHAMKQTAWVNSTDWESQPVAGRTACCAQAQLGGLNQGLSGTNPAGGQSIGLTFGITGFHFIGSKPLSCSAYNRALK